MLLWALGGFVPRSKEPLRLIKLVWMMVPDERLTWSNHNWIVRSTGSSSQRRGMIAVRVVKRISDEMMRQRFGKDVDLSCLGISRACHNTLQALRLAKKCGDRVAIVSLSERPWVFESADQYLPGPIEKIWKGECFESSVFFEVANHYPKSKSDKLCRKNRTETCKANECLFTW